MNRDDLVKVLSKFNKEALEIAYLQLLELGLVHLKNCMHDCDGKCVSILDKEI